MSFLAPLFLLGALAVLGPIAFHLIRRTTREVTPFSTLMFLQPTPPRVTKRSRLENIWLLLLRCLAIALLALGFARPFLQSKATSATAAGGTGKRTVILLDTSASMRREELASTAREKVEELLRNAGPDDQVAVVAFDRSVRPVISFEEWKTLGPGERAAVAGQRLAGVMPTWEGTHLDTALLHAASLLDTPGDDLPHPREIVIVSDLQEGSRVDGVQGYEWPRSIQVTLQTVQAKQEQNAGIQWIVESEETENSGSGEASVRLRISSASEAMREPLAVQWAETKPGEAAAKLSVTITSGRSQTVRAPKPPDATATKLTFSGDQADFDNTVYVLPPETAQIPVLFLGTDPAEDPRGSLYYLRRGFPTTRQQRVEIVAHAGNAPVPGFQLQQAQLLVLGEEPVETSIAAARQFAREGRIVVAPLTSVTSAQTVARLFDLPQLPAAEAKVKDYALLGQIDFQHPLFAAFADPRFSDFTKIHFWKHRQLDTAPLPGARIIARFDSGDPAIVQAPLGKGSVVIFTSSWRTSDSQLALSSKFVPLLHALLEQSRNLPVQKAQYFVGDEVPLPSAAQPFRIRKPDGSEVDAAAESKFAGTDQPGVYAITPGTQRFVVNLAPEESRTAPLAAQRFIALGVPLTNATANLPAVTPEAGARIQAAELENRQKVWRWLIVTALAALLLETILAGRLSRTIGRPATAQT
ncbi:MAG: hypothetical protein JWQ44_1656 [Chthoniobacter sp.]|nr:hypothetical protein [Chthoniobacter sp.]